MNEGSGMNSERLDALLSHFPSVRVAVVGDFFLDRYLIIDPALSEVSLETNLEAYQVVARRCSPGAAGTVTSNVCALGVGMVWAVGVVGDDGNGYDLRQGLRARGVRLDHLLKAPERFTPTYTKPMKRQPDGSEVEINRLDIKNRRPLPPALEDTVIERLRAVVSEVDGVIIADQVQERNCGIITDRVREEIGSLAAAHPEVIFVADSRTRIGEFHHISLKPNQHEAVRAVYPSFPSPCEGGGQGGVDRAVAQSAGLELFARNDRPIFITVGPDGVLVCTGAGCEHVPGIQVSGSIDIVGAGDSVMAGIVAALCSGATPAEAALVGNLVASITIQQLGTTGTATPDQVRARFAEWSAGLLGG
jgi:rfaE bifunctional protein kinase chain/domain